MNYQWIMPLLELTKHDSEISQERDLQETNWHNGNIEWNVSKLSETPYSLVLFCKIWNLARIFARPEPKSGTAEIQYSPQNICLNLLDCHL